MKLQVRCLPADFLPDFSLALDAHLFTVSIQPFLYQTYPTKYWPQSRFPSLFYYNIHNLTKNYTLILLLSVEKVLFAMLKFTNGLHNTLRKPANCQASIVGSPRLKRIVYQFVNSRHQDRQPTIRHADTKLA